MVLLQFLPPSQPASRSYASFQGEGMAFDLMLYVVLMVAGFVLAQVLSPLTQWPLIPMLCLVAALVWLRLAPAAPATAPAEDPTAA